MALGGISFDKDNPKYRQFEDDNGILEYTLEREEMTVDWIAGSNAGSMIKSILAIEGFGVTKISGYTTDKLGRASEEVAQRFANQLASQLGRDWRATVERIEGRRYLILSK